MARIRIEFDADEEILDVEHPSGITEEANEQIMEWVLTMGGNVDVALVNRG